jgi:hypothetical protein
MICIYELLLNVDGIDADIIADAEATTSREYGDVQVHFPVRFRTPAICR